jgi:hypothetical protein
MLTLEPADRAVPPCVALHFTLTALLASTLRQLTVIFSGLVEYGAIIAVDAAMMSVMSALVIVVACAVKLATAPAVSVTLRSTQMPCETSTQPR